MQTYRHLLLFSMCVIKYLTDSAAHDIHSAIKIGKKNHLIECSLGSIVKICVPKAHKNDEYFVYTPSGDDIKLDIDNVSNHYCNNENNAHELTDEYDNENIQIDVEDSYNDGDALEREKTHKNYIDKGTIIIGPLRVQDHGNWMISKYYRNKRNELVEEFQTISIIIIERITSQPLFITLKTGDNFHLSFPHFLPNLETCQLLSETADRYYERDRHRLNLCGYVVKNVSQEDTGLWEIKASGDIEYVTSVYLGVK